MTMIRPGAQALLAALWAAGGATAQQGATDPAAPYAAEVSPPGAEPARIEWMEFRLHLLP